MHIGWSDANRVEGCVVPRWLGLADEDFALDRYLFLPIPLNVFYRTGVKCCVWVRFDKVRERERRIRTAAYAEGVSDGLEQGVREGRAQVLKELAELARMKREAP